MILSVTRESFFFFFWHAAFAHLDLWLAETSLGLAGFYLGLIDFFSPPSLPFAPSKLYGGDCVQCSSGLRRSWRLLFLWRMNCGEPLRSEREADGRARWKRPCIITATSGRLIRPEKYIRCASCHSIRLVFFSSPQLQWTENHLQIWKKKKKPHQQSCVSRQRHCFCAHCWKNKDVLYFIS